MVTMVPDDSGGARLQEAGTDCYVRLRTGVGLEADTELSLVASHEGEGGTGALSLRSTDCDGPPQPEILKRRLAVFAVGRWEGSRRHKPAVAQGCSKVLQVKISAVMADASLDARAANAVEGRLN